MKNSKVLLKENFIQKSQKIHGKFRYNYSLVQYKNNKTKIQLICNKCQNIFNQRPDAHIVQKQGCPKCSNQTKSLKMKMDWNDVLKQFIKIHGTQKFDYSKFIYINDRTKIQVICKKCQKPFYVTPNNHKLKKSGCPKCKSSRGENLIKSFLNSNNIKFITQKRFKDCRNKLPLPFDFYLLFQNVCIEYDGLQHFCKESKYYSKQIPINDNIKTNFCKNNKIQLIRIPYWKINKIESILEKEIFKT